MKNVISAIVILLAGCSHLTDQQQYVRYINNPKNKITQQIKIGEVQATAKWLPPDYRKLNNMGNEESQPIDDDKELYYFDIKFDKTKGEKPVKEKLLYLNFDIQKDFVLLEGTDSLMPIICQKIENGIGGSYQYMLAFENTKPDVEEDFAVIYHDKIFGIGTIAFVYQQKDVRKIPELKTVEPR